MQKNNNNTSNIKGRRKIKKRKNKKKVKMGRKKKGKITMSRKENRRVERGVGGRKDAKGEKLKHLSGIAFCLDDKARWTVRDRHTYIKYEETD